MKVYNKGKCEITIIDRIPQPGKKQAIENIVVLKPGKTEEVSDKTGEKIIKAYPRYLFDAANPDNLSKNKKEKSKAEKAIEKKVKELEKREKALEEREKALEENDKFVQEKPVNEGI